jgi:hypothetical protein
VRRRRTSTAAAPSIHQQINNLIRQSSIFGSPSCAGCCIPNFRSRKHFLCNIAQAVRTPARNMVTKGVVARRAFISRIDPWSLKQESMRLKTRDCDNPARWPALVDFCMGLSETCICFGSTPNRTSMRPSTRPIYNIMMSASTLSCAAATFSLLQEQTIFKKDIGAFSARL